MTRSLSRRQLDILVAFADDKTWKQIQDELGISKNTVWKHRSAAYVKLDVDTLIGAFLALGWLKVPDHMRASVDGAVLGNAIGRRSQSPAA